MPSAIAICPISASWRLTIPNSPSQPKLQQEDPAGMSMNPGAPGFAFETWGILGL